MLLHINKTVPDWHNLFCSAQKRVFVVVVCFPLKIKWLHCEFTGTSLRKWWPLLLSNVHLFLSTTSGTLWQNYRTACIIGHEPSLTNLMFNIDVQWAQNLNFTIKFNIYDFPCPFWQTLTKCRLFIMCILKKKRNIYTYWDIANKIWSINLLKISKCC